MELIRKILVALEDSDLTQDWIPLQIKGYSDDQISYQVTILTERGIISATDCSSLTNFASKNQNRERERERSRNQNFFLINSRIYFGTSGNRCFDRRPFN
ncbi:MAG: DUF2513 domain-containing protein [Verrucomicrobia bacterium]|nr:DUF2513 domain-containing protein [Verrucomicrobiota bacterium]MCF7707578.1 DUF2513 domain-containing protein [Verrucomicrobiota bacterium]